MRDRQRPDSVTRSETRLRFTAQLLLARLALAWERVWPALWPASFVVGAFVALALFDLPARLPDWAATSLLGLFVAALIVTLTHAVRDLRPPSRNAARRRLETASALAHRPLAALEDTLASAGDPATAALWREHLTRMAAAARNLRVGVPRAGLVRRDPYALRVALGLLLLLGAIDAGSDAPARLVRALEPEMNLAGIGGGPAVTLDIWISPPQYTGLPPQFLSASSASGTIAVPIGSTVLARVHGGDARPKLLVDGHATKMSKIDEGDYKGEIAIKAGSRLAVAQGWSTLGSWSIHVVPDLPPTIAFAKPPQRTALGAVHLEYEAKDDYGVEKVTATIRRPGDPSAQAVTLDLPLPDQHLKDAHGASFTDLTASPWAGLPVQIQLEAADALGQTGKSEILEFVLPERVFHNPVARAIIDERKELTTHPNDREAIADALEDLSSRPALYDDDIVAFLGMRSAADRLLLNQDTDAIASVQRLMWDTAVRIDDGGGKLDREALRQSMQALQNALARNAPQSEIDRLMQQLQQQLQHYVQALAQRTLEQNPQAADMPNDPSQTLTSNDLQRILDRARALAQTGDRQAARDLIAALQELLENLGSARPMQMQGSAGMLDAMHDLMRRQEQLLDRTFRQSQTGMSQRGNTGGGAAAQDALRQDLGDLMRKLGENGGTAPAPLAHADRAMGDAADALRRGNSVQAVGPQSEAVDALQQAARALAQQMHGREMGALGNPGENDLPQMRRDPFGRLLPADEGNGSANDGGVMRMGKVQNDYALEKAKQILDELRRRAGEPDRPAIEHDYIDRLLREF
ncbi:MAG: TIGR02302 family protein [Alphaproteobacteria bacterium]|nr:TIGR02302 family protein [Alphaproteobacteria bacterium]